MIWNENIQTFFPSVVLCQILQSDSHDLQVLVDVFCSINFKAMLYEFITFCYLIDGTDVYTTFELRIFFFGQPKFFPKIFLVVRNMSIQLFNFRRVCLLVTKPSMKFAYVGPLKDKPYLLFSNKMNSNYCYNLYSCVFYLSSWL